MKTVSIEEVKKVLQDEGKPVTCETVTEATTKTGRLDLDNVVHELDIICGMLEALEAASVSEAAEFVSWENALDGVLHLACSLREEVISANDEAIKGGAV